LAKSLLSEQERKLLTETRDILEEFLETEEVLRDKALMKSIKDSHRDAKAGRLYTIGQLKKQLRMEGRVSAIWFVGEVVQFLFPVGLSVPINYRTFSRYPSLPHS
jgi:hypothetical protein